MGIDHLTCLSGPISHLPTLNTNTSSITCYIVQLMMHYVASQLATLTLAMTDSVRGRRGG